jgi:hypothetical protein
MHSCGINGLPDDGELYGSNTTLHIQEASS